jgi:hypothetical protein
MNSEEKQIIGHFLNLLKVGIVLGVIAAILAGVIKIFVLPGIEKWIQQKQNDFLKRKPSEAEKQSPTAKREHH